MRRFLIWSAVAALVGLILAGVGVWAYWTFFGQYQPVVVSRDQAEIQRLLDESSWVSEGGVGTPVYVIGYRDSGAMRRWAAEQAPGLQLGGADVRYILIARPDREGLTQSTAAERATVAELWLSRDWTLYQRWTQTPARNWTAAGIPAADGNLARGAVVEAGREFVADLTDRIGAARLKSRYPLILWRDREGFLKACACSEPRSWAFIRDDLGAAPPAPEAQPIEDEPALGAGDEPLPPPPVSNALPYPDLGPAPQMDRSPVDAVPVPETAPDRAPERVLPPPVRQTPRTQPQPQRTPPRAAPDRPAARPPARQAQPPRAPANRRPPEAKRDEDSTFF